MKGSTFKRVFILIVLAVVVIAIPKLMKPILASPSSLVKSVKFVRLSKPNDNPFTSTPIVVNDDDTIRIERSNYYVNFDWEKLSGDTVNAGDSFKIDVSGGMIIAETTTPHPLTVTSSANPATVYPSIGTIAVNNTTVDGHITSHITVTFNNEVNSSEIKALGDIRGTVYLLSTLNLNNPDIQPPENALPSWQPIFNTKIEVLDEPSKTLTLTLIAADYSPTGIIQFKSGNNSSFADSPSKLTTGQTIEVRSTLKAPFGLKLRPSSIRFKYNDFILEYLKGNLSKRTNAEDITAVNIAPLINGISLNNSDFVYTVTPSGFERNAEHMKIEYQEQREKAIATSNLEFKNLEFSNDEFVINYYIYVSATYINDTVFSTDFKTKLLSDESVEYENILIDQPFIKTEGIGNSKKGNVEIKYVYVDPNTSQSKEVMPSIIDNDVLVGSTKYNNYVMPDADRAKLLTVGYVFESSPATFVIEENKTVPLEVRVDKACVDITLRYEYTDNTGAKTYPVPNAVINNAWIKNPIYTDYQLTAAEQKVLDDNGYELEGTINLTITSLDPDDNIFIIPIKLKGSTNTTSSNTTDANTTSANTTSSNTTSANTTSANTTDANTTSSNTTSANTTSSNTTSTNTTSSNTTSSNTTSANTTSSNTTSANTTSSNTTSSRTNSSNTTSSRTTSSNTTSSRTTYYSSNTSSGYYYGGGGSRPEYNDRREPSSNTVSTTTSPVTPAPVTTSWPNTSIVWPSEPPKTTTNPPTFAPSTPTTIPRTPGTVINTDMEYTPPAIDTGNNDSPTKKNPVTNNNDPLIKIVVISLLATILVVLIRTIKANKNYK